MSLIKLKKVSKFYYNNNNISSGFNKINLDLDIGEFVVLTGESGSGKSTLLNVISGLDSYEDGEMYINGKETSHYSEVDYEQYRRKYVGNIFQNFNLVNSYTVYQNIELVLLLNGHKKRKVKNKVNEVINTVGLTKYRNTKVSKLSGGQKQRVAIARALVKETPIIVADEPTGALDVKTAKSIMQLLSEVSKNRLVVIVTHNYEQVENYATRKITMSDGKIIEDKKIKNSSKIESNPIEYKNITLGNKLRLGLRNTFNIKSKLILLLLVYFFLTALVFASYSSIRKMDYDNSNIGQNMYFSNSNVDRIILNKSDRTEFNDEDYNKLNNLDNIRKIVKDDLFLDIGVNLSGEFYGATGSLNSISSIKTVNDGRMPTNDNEIIIVGNKNDYMLSEEKELIYNDTFTIYDDNGNKIKDNIKVVGIKYSNKIEEYEYEFYTLDSIVDIARRLNNIKYSNTELTINGKIYTENSSNLSYRIIPKDDISSGEAIISEDFNTYCPKEKCISNNFHLKVKNSYYEREIDFTPKVIFNQNNFNKYTGLSKDDYYEYSYAIFISNEDYNNLFATNPYQVSIFVKDVKKLNSTAKKLEELGFNTYVMKNMIYSPMKTFMGIIKIIRVITFVISIIVLFFISYFIIRMILKSRNIYYSIIRILGSTRRVSKHLLMLELFNDINIAYFLFVSIIILCKNKIINNNFINSLIIYFKLSDYLIVYLVLVIMSILISSRYARKLFKASALETYREEA